MGCAARHVFDTLMMVRGVEKEKITSRMASIKMMRWPGEGILVGRCAGGCALDACCWLITAPCRRRLRREREHGNSASLKKHVMLRRTTHRRSAGCIYIDDKRLPFTRDNQLCPMTRYHRSFLGER